MMNDLATALTAAGFDVQQQGTTLFVGQWSIHCSLTGKVQARSNIDPADRFGIGTCNDPVDVLACAFATLP